MDDPHAPTVEEVNDKTSANPNKGLYLPKSTIYDIMKTALPPHAKTATKARECVQSCVTEFILFVTGEYAWI